MPNDKRWLRRALLILASVLLLLLILVLAPQRRPADFGEPWKDFSGTKALAHVQALVDLGPRPSGSEAIKKARAYITQELQRQGWQVAEQAFTDATPRGPVTFVNLIATYGGARPGKASRFLLCSHYDTKKFDSITSDVPLTMPW